MGYSVDHLEIIKSKLRNSEPADVRALLEYIEEQLSPHSAHSESANALSIQDIQRAKLDIDSLPLENIEAMVDFTLEQLTLSRIGDKAAYLVGLDKTEFYTRELRYSKLEKFIFHLTAI